LPTPKEDVVATARRVFPGILMVAGGYDLETGAAEIEQKRADLVAFARPWVSNPDLVARWRNGVPLVRLDRDTLYTPGAAGYTDYPTANEAQHSVRPSGQPATVVERGPRHGRFG
jgi:2,4-dienoyl-CoA reductase-like NADH-dependent reductase (Old Yellow Enzyme family)